MRQFYDMAMPETYLHPDPVFYIFDGLFENMCYYHPFGWGSYAQVQSGPLALKTAILNYYED